MTEVYYLNRSSGARRVFTLNAEELTCRYVPGKLSSLLSFADQQGAVVVEFEPSENLLVLRLDSASAPAVAARLRRRMPDIRVAWRLVDGFGEVHTIVPGAVYLELAPELPPSPEGLNLVLLNERLRQIERVAERSFTVDLGADTDVFQALNDLESTALTIAEPIFVTFQPAETEVALTRTSAGIWGDFAYRRKTKGVDAVFHPDFTRFLITYAESTAESPIDALEREGFEVERIESSERVAVVRTAPPFAVQAIDQLPEHARLSAITGLAADIDAIANIDPNTESVVQRAFPVVSDGYGAEVLFLPGELIVGFFDQVSGAPVTHRDARSTLEGEGLTVVSDTGELTFHCRVKNANEIFGVLARLVDFDSVRFAEPVCIEFNPAEATSDPGLANQWNLPSVHAEESWAIEMGLPAVIMVVLDQGVDMNHSELQSMFVELGAENWNFVEPHESPNEMVNQHGTMIAGILGAAHNGESIVGIAPSCCILPIKLYKFSLKTPTLVRALSQLNAHAKMTPDRRYVVNMSFKVSYSEAVELEINKGVALGLVYVGSSGNAKSSNPHYPSDFPGVISVGATEPGGRFAREYSNYGKGVALCAPGGRGLPRNGNHNILSLQSRERTGRDYGTSMAAPHVTAAAALLLSAGMRQRRELTPQQVADYLTSGADPLDDVDPDFAGLMGAGLLNIAASLRQLLTRQN